MKHIFVLVLLASVFACQPKKTETTEESTTDSTEVTLTPVDTTANRLSAEQKTAGWILLFDGQSKTGWRVFKNKENNSWEVVDGTLHCKPFDDNGTNLRADLITENQYDNFELAFDFKISKQGNSGVIFRASEAHDEPYATGPEYQVLDDGGYPGEVKETNFTAGAYDMYAAKNKKLNPPGEWNSGKIVANGNHIEHWLNGEKVVEYEMNSPEWKKIRDASKWKDFPAFATVAKGHVDLQDHGNEVWYKNIMIKPL